MSMLQNLKIVHKVFACIALFAAVVIVATWFAVSHMFSVDRAYSELMDKSTAVNVEIGNLGAKFVQIRVTMWRAIAETDPSMIADTSKNRALRIKETLESFDRLANLAPELKSQIDTMKSTFASIIRIDDQVFALSTQGKSKEAIALVNQGMYDQSRKLTADIADLANRYKQGTVEANNAMTADVRRTATIVISTIAVAGAIVFAIAYLVVTFGIARPLSRVTGILDNVAHGNFAVRIVSDGRRDEVGQITEAVRMMADKVRDTIAEVKASAREVTNASVEISSATTDLSQRTEEQAASLEETSASMEQIAATVRKNAENAQQANASAAQTREVADRGGEVVAQAVNAMAKIEESSRKISDIITVIDEIARQTNLLALNAAVEAARAGEAGRGFAVVASEVRSLAQRSSQAAKDIKDLITNSNSQVKDGVELVNRAGGALTEIVESIKQVAAIVSDIANASIEQSTGIEQVNKALTQMDEVTQQNSALVEENAATAKTLEHQAKAMDEHVAFFRIEEAAGAEGMTQARTVKSVTAKAEARSIPADVKAAPAPAPKRAAAGGARQMQANLATAMKQDTEWKEF